MMNAYQRDSGLGNLANCAPDMSSCACQSAPQKKMKDTLRMMQEVRERL